MSYVLRVQDIIAEATQKLGCLTHGNALTSRQLGMGLAAFVRVMNGEQRLRQYPWKNVIRLTSPTAGTEVTGSDNQIWTCIKSGTMSSSIRPITGALYKAYWALRGTTGGTVTDTTAVTTAGEITINSDSIAVMSAWVQKDSTEHKLMYLTPQDFVSKCAPGRFGQPQYWTLEWSNTITTGKPGFTMKLWPIPDSTDYIIRTFEQIRLTENTKTDIALDFLNTYYDILVYALAADLTHDYRVPLSRAKNIKADYAEKVRRFSESATPQGDSPCGQTSPDM